MALPMSKHKEGYSSLKPGEEQMVHARHETRGQRDFLWCWELWCASTAAELGGVRVQRTAAFSRGSVDSLSQPGRGQLLRHEYPGS